MGARPYRYLALYDPAPGCLVEVGSENGEGSTAWLADYAKRHGLRFYTADVDATVHQRAKEITPGARLCPGTTLLNRVGSVSVAYLDGFDWIPYGKEGQGWVKTMRRDYRDKGLELTRKASESEHLKEAAIVARKATSPCVVIMDDTYWDKGWHGKGAKALPYLEIEGFRVIDHQGHETPGSLGCAVLRRD
jgi:hypothetical protein